MAKNFLIVARWNENISWTKDVPDNWKVVVVQKEKDLPNVGRESSSYLWLLRKYYFRLQPDDTLCFVQGDPFPHYPYLLSALNEPFDGFRGLNASPYPSDKEGGPTDSNLPVKELYEKYIGKFPGTIYFWAGGMFMTKGANVLKHPHKLYREMYKDSISGNRIEYAFERLWPSIFDNRGTPTYTDVIRA